MKIMLGDFLKIAYADDHFYLNISKGREQLYFGYNNEAPPEIMSLFIVEMYLDFVNEAIGIDVSEDPSND